MYLCYKINSNGLTLTISCYRNCNYAPKSFDLKMSPLNPNNCELSEDDLRHMFTPFTRN